MADLTVEQAKAELREGMKKLVWMPSDSSLTHAQDTFNERLTELDALIAAVRADTLTQLQAAIQARFTPALNTGTAMDALVLVGEAIRELEGVPRG